MPRHLIGASTIVLLSLVGAASAQDKTLEADFIDTQGQSIGKAELTQTPLGVLVEVNVTSIPAGEHGFHLHETGTCDPATGFDSAGGHYAPRKHAHGFMDAKGMHAGDMPNQFVGEDGRLHAHAFLEGVTFTGGEAPILDSDGSALIVHGGADDYVSQPSGNAGHRLACAAFKGK